MLGTSATHGRSLFHVSGECQSLMLPFFRPCHQALFPSAASLIDEIFRGLRLGWVALQKLNEQLLLAERVEELRQRSVYGVLYSDTRGTVHRARGILCSRRPSSISAFDTGAGHVVCHWGDGLGDSLPGAKAGGICSEGAPTGRQTLSRHRKAMAAQFATLRVSRFNTLLKNVT